MYNNNQFDGSAAFDGGGFMPSEATQTPGSSFSPAAKNRDSQALLPLTVKQISQALESSDDKTNLLIDGVDVNTVTMVGMVFNRTERVSDVAFELDDGTGRIACIRWLQEQVDTTEIERIMDGMYVRVHGHLKSFQGKKLFTAFSIRPLTEFDELTYHYVDCIYVHDYNTRVRGSAPPLSMSNSAVNTPSKGYQAASSNQHTKAEHFKVGGDVSVDKMVLDYLQKHLLEARGTHLNDIASSLNLPVAKIKETLEALVHEGMAYHTIDDFHYQSTANG